MDIDKRLEDFKDLNLTISEFKDLNLGFGDFKLARGYLFERRHPFLNRILGK